MLWYGDSCCGLVYDFLYPPTLLTCIYSFIGFGRRAYYNNSVTHLIDPVRLSKILFFKIPV
jgi:hypothetical protein